MQAKFNTSGNLSPKSKSYGLYHKFTCVSKTNDTLDIESDVLKTEIFEYWPTFIFHVSACMYVSASWVRCVD